MRPRLNHFAYKLLHISNRFREFTEKLIMRTEDPEISARRAREVKWYKDNGDKTLRVNYPLNHDSIVFDVGGYHGDWAQDIYCLYGPTIYIFEPVKEFVDIIKSKFGNNDSVHTFSFGLSDKNTTSKIYLAEGGTSTIKESGETTSIKLVKAGDFLKKHNIQHIDLLKINIEGGEYDLLDHLFELGFIEHITDIQVQFHNFLPDAQERMESLQKRLSTTHELTYQYPWVWDNWHLKSKRK